MIEQIQTPIADAVDDLAYSSTTLSSGVTPGSHCQRRFLRGGRHFLS